METSEKEHIRKNLVELIRYTKCDVHLLSVLEQCEVLSQADYEDIDSLKTASEKSRRLYEILQTKRGGFSLLTSALRDSRQSGALSILERRETKLRELDRISVDINHVLGKGRAGTMVYKGTFSAREVAVKVIKDEPETALREINFLKKLDQHDNIVRYFEAEIKDSKVYIAMEYCLVSLENEMKMKLVNLDSKTILEKCTRGLAFLHMNRIIHGDLKPANILLNPNGQVKISDFGLSKELDHGRSSKSVSGMHGTADWMAPELLTTDEEDDRANNKLKLTTKSDIFSLGCIFCFVITDGRHLFGSQFERLHNIFKNVPQWDKLTLGDMNKTLISEMVARLPEERPSAEQILKSKYFSPSRYDEALQDAAHTSHMTTKKLIGNDLSNRKPSTSRPSRLLLQDSHQSIYNNLHQNGGDLTQGVADDSNLLGSHKIGTTYQHTPMPYPSPTDLSPESITNAFIAAVIASTPHEPYKLPAAKPEPITNFPERYMPNQGVMAEQMSEGTFTYPNAGSLMQHETYNRFDTKPDHNSYPPEQPLPKKTLQKPNSVQIGGITVDMDIIIGKGFFPSEVHGGYFNGKAVAVKTVRWTAEYICKEVNLLRKLGKHDNVLCYITAEIANKKVYIALEACFTDLLSEMKIPSLNPEPKAVLIQCARGLEFLHHNRVVHKAIKPSNILLNMNGQVKLSDYGLFKPSLLNAVEKREGDEIMSLMSVPGRYGHIIGNEDPDVYNSDDNPICDDGGSVAYIGGVATALIASGESRNDSLDLYDENISNPGSWMAPEFLSNRADENLTVQADIFALGCVFYFHLSNGQHLFGNWPLRSQNILRNRYRWNSSTPEAQMRKLIEKMTFHSPSNRPTAAEVLRDQCLLQNQA